jgi:hypothetical protein
MPQRTAIMFIEIAHYVGVLISIVKQIVNCTEFRYRHNGAVKLLLYMRNYIKFFQII